MAHGELRLEVFQDRHAQFGEERGHRAVGLRRRQGAAAAEDVPGEEDGLRLVVEFLLAPLEAHGQGDRPGLGVEDLARDAPVERGHLRLGAPDRLEDLGGVD